MTGIHDVPDLQKIKPDQSRFSRLEMEDQIRQVWPKPHTWRLKANSEYGLPNKDSFRLRPISVLHWMLDEQLRRGEIVGEELGIKPELETDTNQLTFITQRLADFIQRRLALKPKEGEGINMSDLTRFTPPSPISTPPQPSFSPPPFPSTGPAPTPGPNFTPTPPFSTAPTPMSNTSPVTTAPLPPGMTGPLPSSTIPSVIPQDEPVKRRGKRSTPETTASPMTPMPTAPLPMNPMNTPMPPIPPVNQNTDTSVRDTLGEIKELLKNGSPEVMTRLTHLEGILVKQERKLVLIDTALSLVIGQMYGKLGTGVAANLEAMLQAAGLSLPQ